MIQYKFEDGYTRPVPTSIADDILFLPDDLSEEDYEREIRRIVRENLPLTREDLEEDVFSEYDPQIWEIIREEIARN